MATLSVEVSDSVMDYIDSVVERTGVSRGEASDIVVQYCVNASALVKLVEKHSGHHPFTEEGARRAGLKLS